MRSIQTQHLFPLSAVKPLDGLLNYRAFCLAATRKALAGRTHRLERSWSSAVRLEPCGALEGLAYVRDPEHGGLFLADRPEPAPWGRLLSEVNRHRHSPAAFHAGLTQSRVDHVYAPKLEWIEDALRLQEIPQTSIMEVVTAPSDFTEFLTESRSFSEVLTVDETELATDRADGSGGPQVGAAVLLESLDRALDPAALLRGVVNRVEEGGLVFVTALVSSGFDMTVLGLRNLYLTPPDRANCFSLHGLTALLRQSGLSPLEVSTPGVLDVEIVQAHVQHDPSVPLSAFERQLVDADGETHEVFQTFLQQRGLSSFARIVTRKQR